VAEYYGTAWYRQTFDVPADGRTFAMRVEFEAVFHTTTVWINGQMAGEHRGKGYTAFTFDVTHLQDVQISEFSPASLARLEVKFTQYPLASDLM
jgi:beta-galactosidase/beta-glucuronidase